MNETKTKTLDRGWWCKSCGWFEDAESLTVEAGCTGCGCPPVDHIAAKVVSA